MNMYIADFPRYTDLTGMELVAGLLFATVLVLFSYRFNYWLIGDRLKADPYRMTLTASAVLLLAIVAESLVNPVYEAWLGNKLWEYRILPLHDRNVSALAVLVWTAYGIHMYFARQSLALKLTGRWNGNAGKSLILGCEAPLVFEVSGNLLFLSLSGTYYAYYLPSDLAHLTSLQVVPAYVLCIFIGLLVLRGLESLPRHAGLPVALFAGGIAYLLAG